jgi:ABC-type phosphate transport system permease subunit
MITLIRNVDTSIPFRFFYSLLRKVQRFLVILHILYCVFMLWLICISLRHRTQSIVSKFHLHLFFFFQRSFSVSLSQQHKTLLSTIIILWISNFNCIFLLHKNIYTYIYLHCNLFLCVQIVSYNQTTKEIVHF